LDQFDAMMPAVHPQEQPAGIAIERLEPDQPGGIIPPRRQIGDRQPEIAKFCNRAHHQPFSLKNCEISALKRSLCSSCAQCPHWPKICSCERGMISFMRMALLTGTKTSS